MGRHPTAYSKKKIGERDFKRKLPIPDRVYQAFVELSFGRIIKRTKFYEELELKLQANTNDCFFSNHRNGFMKNRRGLWDKWIWEAPPGGSLMCWRATSEDLTELLSNLPERRTENWFKFQSEPQSGNGDMLQEGLLGLEKKRKMGLRGF